MCSRQEGSATWKGRASSVVAAGPRPSRSTTARRVGWAKARKTGSKYLGIFLSIGKARPDVNPSRCEQAVSIDPQRPILPECLTLRSGPQDLSRSVPMRHVETWATQRETWRRTPDGWKLYRVDSVRDQRRLVDGQPD